MTMSTPMVMTQPAQAQQKFLEQTTTYHLNSAGPDPELKKVLPLAFAALELEISTSHQSDEDIFGELYVDKVRGAIRKSVGSQKVSPIDVGNLKGISTYFSRFHPGIDYRADVGSPIHATLPGIVNEVSYERGGYGRFVVIMHSVDGKTMFSLYAHMRSTTVEAGQSVDAGDKIGEVGLTGHTTGPHLHFELHDELRAINPIRFFASNTLAMINK